MKKKTIIKMAENEADKIRLNTNLMITDPWAVAKIAYIKGFKKAKKLLKNV